MPQKTTGFTFHFALSEQSGSFIVLLLYPHTLHLYTLSGTKNLWIGCRYVWV